MAVCLDRAVLNSIYIQNRPRAVKEIDAIVYFHMRNRPCCPILARKFSAGTHGLSVKRQTRIRILGCPEGRSASTWVDYNLLGHQIVCHQVPDYNASATAIAVDGDPVPVPHFGLAMSSTQFHELATKLKAGGVKFVIEPHIRFEGQPGEQWTMFFKDRSGNSLEFKAMTNPKNLFAKYVVQE